jgi:predicted dehydrogenase
MFEKRLKIALVGCGQIADAHMQEIRKLANVDLVAVCDRVRDLAYQAAARFQVHGIFDDVGTMLREACPDVVHVTTPPHTHFPIAHQILSAGAHVYVEKPFTVDLAEADLLLHFAQRQHRLLCVGHDQLFDPVWLQCRQCVERGHLGRLVHVDSIQGYDLNGPFGRLLKAEPGHWVHRLPGGLFQNVISHALYRITDLMPDAQPQIWATWYSGDRQSSFPTELRVLLRGADTTASLLFSSSARPLQRIIRLYGTRAAVEVDFDAQLQRRAIANRLPGALGKIDIPLQNLVQAARGFGRNIWRFLRSDIHYFAGMNNLFARFYQAVRENGSPPVSYEEIRRVTALMDQIFGLCTEQARTRPSRRSRPVREGSAVMQAS